MASIDGKIQSMVAEFSTTSHLRERDVEIFTRNIEQLVDDRVAEKMRVLAAALGKFAPDLVEALRERHADARGALDDFVSVMRE